MHNSPSHQIFFIHRPYLNIADAVALHRSHQGRHAVEIVIDVGYVARHIPRHRPGCIVAEVPARELSGRYVHRAFERHLLGCNALEGRESVGFKHQVHNNVSNNPTYANRLCRYRNL